MQAQRVYGRPLHFGSDIDDVPKRIHALYDASQAELDRWVEACLVLVFGRLRKRGLLEQENKKNLLFPSTIRPTNLKNPRLEKK